MLILDQPFVQFGFVISSKGPRRLFASHEYKVEALFTQSIMVTMVVKQ